jgi:hypothetical protein
MLAVYIQIRSLTAMFVCGTFGEAPSFCGNDKGCFGAAAMLIAVTPYWTQTEHPHATSSEHTL